MTQCRACAVDKPKFITSIEPPKKTGQVTFHTIKKTVPPNSHHCNVLLQYSAVSCLLYYNKYVLLWCLISLFDKCFKVCDYLLSFWSVNCITVLYHFTRLFQLFQWPRCLPRKYDRQSKKLNFILLFLYTCFVKMSWGNHGISKIIDKPMTYWKIIYTHNVMAAPLCVTVAFTSSGVSCFSIIQWPVVNYFLFYWLLLLVQRIT